MAGVCGCGPFWAMWEKLLHAMCKSRQIQHIRMECMLTGWATLAHGVQCRSSHDSHVTCNTAQLLRIRIGHRHRMEDPHFEKYSSIASCHRGQVMDVHSARALLVHIERKSHTLSSTLPQSSDMLLLYVLRCLLHLGVLVATAAPQLPINSAVLPTSLRAITCALNRVLPQASLGACLGEHLAPARLSLPAVTALRHRCLEVIDVDPIVCAPLLALEDGHGLVVRPCVLRSGVRVQAMWPQHGGAFARVNRLIDVREVGAAALLHVGQVEEEGEGARSAPRIKLLGNPVMVQSIVLANAIAEQLHVLGIVGMKANDIHHALDDTFVHRVLEAATVLAPRIVRRPDLVGYIS
mmetsp:Transcript_24854/g.63293  ORF Transcript_24854/g.63293 Transcript_24854/m.63293 type:complete len:351 (+) Transcript_24854:106-1158(+)